MLSALEGIAVQNDAFKPFILPLTLIVLVGPVCGAGATAPHKIGRLFGPVILVWFLSLAALGVAAIAKAPQILAALNPSYGLALFVLEPWTAFVDVGRGGAGGDGLRGALRRYGSFRRVSRSSMAGCSSRCRRCC